MKYKLIMFDMDGTLLPMDNDEFTEGYFKLLCKEVIEYIDPKSFVSALWHGIKAMRLSDGKKTNVDAFWEDFEENTGLKRSVMEPICDKFYGGEFALSKNFTKDNPLAKEAVKIAHKKANSVVLATNPFFPMVAQKMRLSFIDLTVNDFDMVTAYEENYFIKPDTRYYMSILDKFNVKPNECLMIGNDESEDCYPCSQLGIDCFLVEDRVIKSNDHPFNGKKGSFADMVAFLEGLE